MVSSSGSARPERRRVLPAVVVTVLVVLAVVVAVVAGVRMTGDASGAGHTGDAAVRAQTTDRLDGIVAEVADRYHVTVGVSLRAGEGTVHAGPLQSVRAWSTSKVPVAVAAVRAAQEQPTTAPAVPASAPGSVADDLTAALTVSDNDAAMRLWSGLGTWQQASRALTRVLAETGDPTDAVAAEQDPDYTGFGDIHWSLDNQVTFADGLACLDGSAPVLDAMGQVVPVQRMGFGVLPGSRFKGGWGPEDDGTYTLREFGLVGEPGRQVPVAYAVVPDDGSDITAREAAEALARELGPLAESVADRGGAARCQVPDSVPAASTEAPVSAADYAAQYGGGA